MSRYPDAVEVVIVGSGPTGAAYARILSEEAPDATIAVFEVGPTVSDPPGAHVKNIEDPAVRAEAQERRRQRSLERRVQEIERERRRRSRAAKKGWRTRRAAQGPAPS